MHASASTTLTLCVENSSEAREGKVGGKVEKVVAKGEEVRDRSGDGGRSEELRCGASAPYCYSMTLTGLCNQTGLAFASQQQTPAALTVM